MWERQDTTEPDVVKRQADSLERQTGINQWAPSVESDNIMGKINYKDASIEGMLKYFNAYGFIYTCSADSQTVEIEEYPES